MKALSGKVEHTRGRRARTIVLILSGTVFLVCAGIVAAFGVWWPTLKSILIGDVTGFQISYIAGVVGLVGATVFVFTAPAHRWWLLLAIPLRIGVSLALVLASLGLTFVDTKVTPIFVDGCESGYIAIEPLGGGGSFVGVRDGILVDTVQEFGGPDFSRPFADGDYSARVHGTEIDVWYNGATRPAFTLPALGTESCN